jgi:preprotein translocase subunit Sec61beta
MDNSLQQQDDSWKVKTYLIGGIVGAAIGLATAFLIAHNAEEEHGPPQIEPTDALKLGVAVIGLMRGFAALGK